MRTYEETLDALNAMIPEIHANAVAHGWWEGGRDVSEIFSLIHSELSEALEEYRDDKPEFYCTAYGGDWCGICYGNGGCKRQNPSGDNCYQCIERRAESEKTPYKPEGIIVELADAIIRILDYLGADNSVLMESDTKPEDAQNLLPVLIAFSHLQVSRAFLAVACEEQLHGVDGRESRDKGFADTVMYIWSYARAHGFDLTEVIRVKHEYNKTRAYKHGGKVI